MTGKIRLTGPVQGGIKVTTSKMYVFRKRAQKLKT